MVDLDPVQMPDDDGGDNHEADSTSEVEIPTAATFEQLVHEVQHDLACLDIDKEERELINRFISTAKVFASFYFDHLVEDV
jgi:hypothetical protein